MYVCIHVRMVWIYVQRVFGNLSARMYAPMLCDAQQMSSLCVWYIRHTNFSQMHTSCMCRYVSLTCIYTCILPRHMHVDTMYESVSGIHMHLSETYADRCMYVSIWDMCMYVFFMLTIHLNTREPHQIPSQTATTTMIPMYVSVILYVDVLRVISVRMVTTFT
jgi:hypothetical protein